MSLTGIRDLSLIQTPPADRQPILTYVGEYDERAVAEAIRRELLREGQVFYVHNRVQSIDHCAARLRELVPEARIAVAHGQMDEGTLEQVVVDFWEGDYDVLVCTTIIESGIDMPTVNTLVVERSDLLGLGQLHQLRGRVGRSGQRAYAYLFHPADRVLTEEAYERLRTIGEATELGSGFKIAMRDLEIRGAGNLLGEHQSGHIAAVGYDLYVQMVNEAVAEMKGEAPREPAEVKLDVPTDAFLPLDYVTKEELRLEAYRRLAAVTSHAEVDDIAAEWEDRYGPVPEPAANLLAVGHLRAECFRLGLRDVSITADSARLAPIELRTSETLRLRRVARDAIYKEPLHQLVLPLRRGQEPTRHLLAVLGELFPDTDGGRQEARHRGRGRVARVIADPSLASAAGALALAVPAALAVALSSCSTVPARAATVNGTAISRSDFERDLEALAANPGLLNLTGGTDVSIDGPTARSWLSQVITWKTAEDLLSEHGLSTTQESIDAIQAQIAGNPTAAKLPQSMQDEVVAGAAAVQSLTPAHRPRRPRTSRRSTATTRPATGALCVSHILRRDGGRGPGRGGRARGRRGLRRGGQGALDRARRGDDRRRAGRGRRQRLPVGRDLPDAVRRRLHRRRPRRHRRGADRSHQEPVRLARHPPPPVRGGRRRPGHARRQLAGRGRARPERWPRPTSRSTPATASGAGRRATSSPCTDR